MNEIMITTNEKETNKTLISLSWVNRVKEFRYGPFSSSYACLGHPMKMRESFYHYFHTSGRDAMMLSSRLRRLAADVQYSLPGYKV